jgi:hypothetical protein
VPLSCPAMELRLVWPAAWMFRMIGSTLVAKCAACGCEPREEDSYSQTEATCSSDNRVLPVEQTEATCSSDNRVLPVEQTEATCSSDNRVLPVEKLGSRFRRLPRRRRHWINNHRPVRN